MSVEVKERVGLSELPVDRLGNFIGLVSIEEVWYVASGEQIGKVLHERLVSDLVVGEQKDSVGFLEPCGL